MLAVYFTVKDAKILECEHCENWFCDSCTRAWLSDEEYASLSQAHSRLLWYYKDCGEGVFTTVKTDNLIEEKCRQYIKDFKDDLQHSSQRI